jgi:2-phosphoglycerate kinase
VKLHSYATMKQIAQRLGARGMIDEEQLRDVMGQIIS